MGELKKGMYIYYHHGSLDPEYRHIYSREEALEKQFSEILGSFRFDDEVLG